MSEDSFVGRGENRVVEILKKLFPKYKIIQQMPIRNLIGESQFEELGAEHRKHNHDIVILTDTKSHIVIEINYKHGPIAQAKWHVYKKHLENAGHIALEITDADCRSLFELKKGSHVDSWQDWIDVIHVLEKHGVME